MFYHCEGPLYSDTSKTAKIIWAMDVIYDFHYIHSPLED